MLLPAAITDYYAIIFDAAYADADAFHFRRGYCWYIHWITGITATPLATLLRLLPLSD